MSYNVTLKTIPERYAATNRMTIPRYEDEGMIWGKLAEETCRMNLVEDDPCLCAVTYLDGEYEEIKYCKGIRCPGLIKAGAIAHPGVVVR